MERKVEILKEKFPDIEIERREHNPIFVNEDGEIDESEEVSVFYRITSISGNDNVTINVEKIEEVEKLISFLENSPEIFNDFVGIKYATQAEVLLKPVSRFSSGRFLRDGEKKIQVNLSHFGIEYKISIQQADDDHLISYFAENVREVRTMSRSIGTIMVIRRKSGGIVSLNESSIRELIFSVLFDIEYTYGLGLETRKYDSSLSRRRYRGLRPAPLPDEEISLIHKNYIPELIEYFHTADKVDYLPFKYICYFHVVEYFMDKSAYSVASKKVKELLLKPDFHVKTNEYIAQAINIFKKENDRFQTDKIKIHRVFKEFVSLEETKQAISDMGLYDHFTNEHILTCSKPLNVCAINLDVENEFFNSISKRVYSLRCSIVHSNPDFDESKAIPFVPSEDNFFFLRKEILILKFLANTIIAKSAIMS